MGKEIGILMEPNGDLLINPVKDITGKILHGVVIGNSTRQTQAFIIQASPVAYKEKPHVGAGVFDMLNDENASDMKAIIRQQLEQEGQRVKYVKLYGDNTLEIDASYR